ncbi:hypothetical protein SAMN05444166_5679 [Singulisphaera sp. GP187]|uniref:hypothetical protein n=1 Tax=Singulisphaera sp. GP187 TaxID=1882752 RepID=UPI000926CECC|nr:hypothetical protein [Singulisphaera sp. GP187]SIO58438.1 hypothetical protein SAMN05444166_5679 [Singulisphaera sp. GP187]
MIATIASPDTTATGIGSPAGISGDVLEGLAEGIAQLVRQGFDAELIVERIDRAADGLGLPASHPACQAFRETARTMTMEAMEGRTVSSPGV